MFTKRSIQRKIILPATALGPDLSSIVAGVVESMEGNVCTKNTGYILRVTSDVALSTPLISNANSEVYLDAQFEAETLLPTIGQEINGIIWRTFSEGIFLEVKSILKVLVPSATIPGYVYSADGSSSFDSGSLEVGLSVNSIITGVRYRRGAFSVVAAFQTINTS